MRVRSTLTHSGLAVIEAAIVVAIIAALFLALSPVIRPDTRRRPWLASLSGPRALVVPNGTFAGTSTATASGAYLGPRQVLTGGTLVYEQWVKSDSARHATFTLGPTPMWQSGSASCWAEDGTWNNSRWRQNATTTFSDRADLREDHRERAGPVGRPLDSGSRLGRPAGGRPRWTSARLRDDCAERVGGVRQVAERRARNAAEVALRDAEGAEVRRDEIDHCRACHRMPRQGSRC